MTNDTDSFVQEVDESLRQDRFVDLLKKWGPWLLGAFVLIIAGVAFWMHLTVLWTGSLHLAIAVHAVYDLIATFTMAKWVKREEAAAAASATQA